MLFTWKSGSANNELSTGNVKIALWEGTDSDSYQEIGAETKPSTPPDFYQYNGYPDSQNTFSGLDWTGTTGYPFKPTVVGSANTDEQPIPKYTEITNVGEGSAYLKVEVVFTFSGTKDPGTPDSVTRNEYQTVLSQLLYSNQFNQFYRGDIKDVSDTNNPYSYEVTFYYVDNSVSGAPVLKILPSNGTVDLFTGLSVPDLTEIVDDTLTLDITVQAKAVQSDNNTITYDYSTPPTSTIDSFETAFEGHSWTNQN